MTEKVYLVSNGVTVTIKDRRKYGNTTYTWLRFTDANGKESTPDPWPVSKPPVAEVVADCKVISERNA